MNTVTRCDLESDYGGGYMRIHASGDYVTYEDYENDILDIKYDLDILQKKYDRLVEKLGELYRES